MRKILLCSLFFLKWRQVPLQLNCHWEYLSLYPIRSLFQGIVVCLSLALPGVVFAQSVGPLVMPPTPYDQLRAEAPPRLADRVEVASLARLKPAEVAAIDQLDAMKAWNEAGRLPTQNGFSRPLPLPQLVRIDGSLATVTPTPWAGGMLARLDQGQVVWTTRVEVEDAYRLRLHLSDVELPEGAKLWVYSGDEVAGPFGAELIAPEGDLWTPSVAGPAVVLEVVLPSTAQGELRLELDRVLEVFGSSVAITAPGSNIGCLVDGQCVGADTLDVIDLYRRAVAQLFFVKGDAGGVCTGALLNDTDDSTTVPYLLTANHCFDSPQSALTLETRWDYTTDSCGGQFPNLGGLPKFTGATLLATSVGTDFTLVRLHTVPPGRVFLGWDARVAAVTPGTVLHRLSHPAPDQVGFPLPQVYSQTVVAGSAASCGGSDEDGRPLDNPAQFIKSGKLSGGTTGGSSGAPTILSGGVVVGQLYGQCGALVDEGCSLLNQAVDGAFSATFPFIAHFLDPQPTSTEPCVPGPNTLCLSNDRFEVTVDWETRNGDGGEAGAVELTPDTGYFWFFTDTNVEMVIKVLNACSFADRIWVFSGGLTNVRTVVTVRDTREGVVKTYVNPQSTPFQPIQDTDAFATCP